MENRQRDGRKVALFVDIDMLVPKGHLLRKVMDYEWIRDRLEPYYSKRMGRPSIDPVVLIKMVLIQHLFDIPSLRQRKTRYAVIYTTVAWPALRNGSGLSLLP